jgi:hypothetical protein
LYNILFEFGIPVSLVRLLYVCLNVTFIKIGVSRTPSNAFRIQNGLLLLFNFGLEYAIRKDELSGKHQILVYADSVNGLGGDINILRKKHRSSVTGYLGRLVGYKCRGI